MNHQIAYWTAPPDPKTNFPPYINASSIVPGGGVRVIVRQMPQEGYANGSSAHIDLPPAAWREFVRDAALKMGAGHRRALIDILMRAAP